MAGKSDIAEFNEELVAGNAKNAVKNAGAAKGEMLMVPVGKLRVIEGFNVRVTSSPRYKEKFEELVNSIVQNGFFAHKPIAAYVMKDGEEDVFAITDGHTRFAAVQEAINRGAPVEMLPVVVGRAGTSMEDLTVELAQANSGSPLTPLELSFVANRLSKFGWENARIATKLGYTPQYVEGLILLAGSPNSIRKNVALDRISAATAIEVIRKKKDKAPEEIKKMLDTAAARGKTKATKKDSSDRAPKAERAPKADKAPKETPAATAEAAADTLESAVDDRKIVVSTAPVFEFVKGDVVAMSAIDPVKAFGKGEWFKLGAQKGMAEIVLNTRITVSCECWELPEPANDATPPESTVAALAADL